MKYFSKISVVLIIFIGSFCVACQSDISRRAQNIEAFARLYGYARWFHPSDEAQEIDWDKFAVLGVQKVENIKSTEELRDTLYQLFSPIVQGLQIYKTNKPERFNSDILLSPDSNAKPVVWQHLGIDLKNELYANGYSPYKSVRVNKNEFNRSTDATIVCKIFTDLSHLRGKEVKLSGYFKTKNQKEENVKLFIQYHLPNDNIIHDVSVDSQDWDKQELTTTIPEDATLVAYGLWIVGDSEVWADDFEFSVDNRGKWEVFDTVNMGFENGQIDVSQANDWKTLNMQYCTLEVTDKNAHSGKYSLNLQFNFSGKIFDQMPQFGEVINEPIGRNLTCVVPLTLLTNDSVTYPTSESSSLQSLKTELAKIELKPAFNMQTNLASVIIAWNVLQHFFPYFDVIDTDWNKVLGETLKSAFTDNRRKDFFITLSQMIAQIDDGHGWFYNPERWYHLPIRTEFIENQIVITASNNTGLKIGDIIKRIDGKPAMRALNEKEGIISGSPQLRRHRALNILGSKLDSGETQLVIERDGNEQSITIPNLLSHKPGAENKYRNETIVEIEPGIYYVNMSRTQVHQFDEKVDELANAKAVIYDQRNVYSEMQHHIIPHLISEPVNSPWWNVPQTIYPNRKEVEFSKSNWSIHPKQPLFKSKAIIITNPGMVSSAETALGIIDHYNLATTVGEPTAGCNGNVNPMQLPCGYNLAWTGMKVLKQDGNQHYLIGYEPDYPVNKTIQAIKEGRDEYLEKALEIARR
ncbi:MAG: hypothetical protein LBI15_04690 [Dysgonamonadaceae bacterium]|jgi:C-terminal processing protease CtpA/Prc|nr:hypothetical protein [Dysgonamonadaceae bacterium]